MLEPYPLSDLHYNHPTVVNGPLYVKLAVVLLQKGPMTARQLVDEMELAFGKQYRLNSVAHSLSRHPSLLNAKEGNMWELDSEVKELTRMPPRLDRAGKHVDSEDPEEPSSSTRRKVKAIRANRELSSSASELPEGSAPVSRKMRKANVRQVYGHLIDTPGLTPATSPAESSSPATPLQPVAELELLMLEKAAYEYDSVFGFPDPAPDHIQLPEGSLLSSSTNPVAIGKAPAFPSTVPAIDRGRAPAPWALLPEHSSAHAAAAPSHPVNLLFHSSAPSNASGLATLSPFGVPSFPAGAGGYVSQGTDNRRWLPMGFVPLSHVQDPTVYYGPVGADRVPVHGLTANGSNLGSTRSMPNDLPPLSTTGSFTGVDWLDILSQ